MNGLGRFLELAVDGTPTSVSSASSFGVLDTICFTLVTFVMITLAYYVFLMLMQPVFKPMHSVLDWLSECIIDFMYEDNHGHWFLVAAIFIAMYLVGVAINEVMR